MTSSEKIKQVLVVHSSAELYGSDRSLLDFVRNRAPGLALTIVLPEDGPLVAKLESAGAKVFVGNVCKIQRGMLSPSGLITMLAAAIKSVRFLYSLRPVGGFDLVYSNSVAVLGGGLSALVMRVPHVWHVREIINGSSVLSGGFRFLVSALSKTIICNSSQTRDWICPRNGDVRYVVIWNGFDLPPGADVGRAEARASLGVAADDILFVLVGRVNAWKGQLLLVKAFELMMLGLGESCSARLVLIGSAPHGQEHFELDLRQAIEAGPCSQLISWQPFRNDIDSIWRAADVAVVPSTEPEPFGRVAIEAMGFGLPVIAARHGGLLDIVIDGETGLLVEPKSAESLCAALTRLLLNKEQRVEMGRAGKQRQEASFSVASYAASVSHALNAARSKVDG